MLKIIKVKSCGDCPFIGHRNFLENKKHICKDVCTNPDSKSTWDTDWIVIVNKNLIHPECPLEEYN